MFFYNLIYIYNAKIRSQTNAGGRKYNLGKNVPRLLGGGGHFRN